jgi:hypothetical protein
VKAKHQGDYRARRREAYPPIGEQLDALWKALAELRRQGYSLGADADAMQAAVAAVKARFPAPRS